jgi:hypothetical protein
MGRDSGNQRGHLFEPGGVITDETDLRAFEEAPGSAQMVFHPRDHPAGSRQAAVGRRGVMQPAKQHSGLAVDLRFGAARHGQLTRWLSGQGRDHHGPQVRVGGQQDRGATWPEGSRPMPVGGDFPCVEPC